MVVGAFHGLVREGLEKIASKFSSENDMGPKFVADFGETDHPEGGGLRQRDAYERMHFVLEILAFAETLEHPARDILERPFVHYVQNLVLRARDHFYGLREAKPDLVGLSLFDRVDIPLRSSADLKEVMWKRREIENYVCYKEVILAWAQDACGDMAKGAPLFTNDWLSRMEECITELEQALETTGKGSPWSADMKVSDEFLDPLFRNFFKRLGLTNLMRKTDFHQLARYVPRHLLDHEISAVLDLVVDVARRANPAR